VTYKSLMVHLQLRQSNDGVLRIAADLAERFHAGVIGIAVCQPMQIVQGDAYVSGDLIEQDREEITQEIKEAERAFRQALGTCAGPVEWRSAVTIAALPGYLAKEARGADLIITGIEPDAALFDGSRHVDVGDLAMQAGRPVLIVPAKTDRLNLERVVVGWKDTREARRAIADAVPLLIRAGHVALVEIAAESDLPAARGHLADVVAWLARHGAVAEPVALESNGDDAGLLAAVARDQKADLVVAGAYGHSRLREWAFGGVTRNFLRHADQCLLVSH
jgi:nucleotide-binding universal stress UspA family protein